MLEFEWTEEEIDKLIRVAEMNSNDWVYIKDHYFKELSVSQIK